jgi:glycosyltransferase involved in cell wall biosynthesis
MAGANTSQVRVASVVKRLHVGGDEKRLLTLARAFDRDAVNHVVVVVNPTDRDRDARMGRMLHEYMESGVNVEVLGDELLAPDRRRGPRDLWAVPSVLGRLTRLLKDRRVDVVDARLEFGAAFGLAAARLAGVPIVVATGYSPVFWNSPIRYPIGQLAMRSLDALITDSAPAVRHYDAWRLSKRARLALIPNGIDRAVPVRAREDVRGELGLPLDALVVGQVARMLPYKGQETLIEAARLVVDRAPDVHFLLCGFAESVEYRDHLRSLVDSRGLAGNVVLTSYAGPVGDVLGAIDAFAHLSSLDSSPIAVIEAMSAGLPMVVTRVGGTPDLVIDRESGILVPVGDAAAAAAALVELLGDSGLRARLGIAAQERYEQRHRVDAMVTAHTELFFDLLRERRRMRA